MTHNAQFLKNDRKVIIQSTGLSQKYCKNQNVDLLFFRMGKKERKQRVYVSTVF